MLAYKWSSMSFSALVHLGEKKTEEYRVLIELAKDRESRLSSDEGTV